MDSIDKDRENYIIRQIKKGRYELFSELINTYQSPVYYFIRKIVYNDDDARDIVQETLFKAYRSIKKFKQQSKFSTWLFQIGYNESINFIKKHKRRKQIERNLNLSNISDNRNSSGKSIEASELNDDIEILLKKLKEEQRIALHLLYDEDKSYLEIAEIMEMPINTVKSHIRRGKEILRQKLSEIYDPDTILA